MTALTIFLIGLSVGVVGLSSIFWYALRDYKRSVAHNTLKEIIDTRWDDERDVYKKFRKMGIDFSWAEFRIFMSKMVRIRRLETFPKGEYRGLASQPQRWYRLRPQGGLPQYEHISRYN